MGTTLTGTQINNTYDGLIKTTDNTAITATTKLISDGLGNDTCIKVGTAGTDFLGAVDFSAATVTGLPGGAGLVSGTGTDSMQSAASLTTVAANASGNCSIALGDNAYAGTDGISLGRDACSNGDGQAIGFSSHARGTKAISIGETNCAYDSYDISIGYQSSACGPAATAIGWGASVAAGNFHGIAIGCGSSTTATYGVALGSTTVASASGAVALGYGVTASIADTVSVKALETQTASTPTAGGIIMNDAGSVARRLNIDASGNLQIDSTPVGGGGAAGLVSGAGTDSMISDSSLTTLPATGAGNCSISLGNDAQASTQFDISIGHATRGGGQYGVALGHTASSASSGFGVAIGCGSQATGGGQNIAIGKNARACVLSENIAIGSNACAGGNAGVIAIGKDACVFGVQSYATAIGARSRSCAIGAIAIGGNAAYACNVYSIAIGTNVCVTADCAVALGIGITASRVDTVAGNQFEAKTVGKGIVVTSPDGLTTLGIGIDNTGAIVTYTP